MKWVVKISFVVIVVLIVFVGNSSAGTYSGGSGTEGDPYLIEEPNDIIEMSETTDDWGGRFLMISDVNMVDYTFTTAVVDTFEGVFNGAGHKILNLTIDTLGADTWYLGLFGRIDEGAEVSNLSLDNVSVIGGNDSRILGGLCGRNGGTIINCYATGSVSGLLNVGVLCGSNDKGTINNSSATGSATGSFRIGGLCGLNFYSSTISNCCATVSVSGGVGSQDIGGLCGHNYSTINNCYSTGSVSGITNVGGLCGYNSGGTFDNCFWDTDTSGLDWSAGGTGLPTEDMQKLITFTAAGWDFVEESANGTEDIWRMCVDGIDYPHLYFQHKVNGDFVCPDGVDGIDLGVLCDEWLLMQLSWDVWPEGGDGIVNFLDWAVFAEGWQLTNDFDDLNDFVDQWLQPGANYFIADIAPVPDGDGIVNLKDFVLLAEHWLEQ
jgi:hypothetical protein